MATVLSGFILSKQSTNIESIQNHRRNSWGAKGCLAPPNYIIAF